MQRTGLLTVFSVLAACQAAPSAGSNSSSTSGGSVSGSSLSATSTRSPSSASTAPARSSSSSGGEAEGVCVSWVFNGSAAPFTLDNGLVLGTPQVAGSVTLNAVGGDPYMSVVASADLGACRILEVEYSVPSSAAGAAGQFFWVRDSDAGSFNEPESRIFPLAADGAVHTYRVDVQSNAMWSGTLRSLRFDPFNAAAGNFTLRSITLKRVISGGSSSSSSSFSASSSSSNAAVACSTPLLQRLHVNSVSITGRVEVGDDYGWATNRPIHLAALANGSSRVAWTDGSSVHITPLNAQDQRAGADVTAVAESVRGLVAHEDGTNALLLVRGQSMYFVKLARDGSGLVENQLVGAQSPDTDGAKWLSSWGHQGRLVWNGTQYHAYFGHNQNFGASIGTHQGDVFYLLDAAGQMAGEWWDWGCSHSLDLRLAQNATTVGAVCLSDAYPVKAVLFNHNTLIHGEPTGNMAGSSEGMLGGLVGLPQGGFGLTFASPEGRCSDVDAQGNCPTGGNKRDVAYARLTDSGQVMGAITWLTNTLADAEEAPKLGRVGAQLLAGWRVGATYKLALLDADGHTLEGPVDAPVAWAHKDDFTTHPNGDLSWAFAWGGDGELKVVRVTACQ